MISRRTPSALVAVLIALACALTVAGPSAAVAPMAIATEDEPPPATQPPHEPRPGPNRPGSANAPIRPGSYFSFPNRSAGERLAIRNRVVSSINSTWGYWYSPEYEDPLWPSRISGWTPHRGTIRMTTWSFNDWGVRDALVRAAQRGTRVQIIAAENVNRVEKYQPWKSLKAALNSSANRARGNAAWECSGACRGSGGAPHSKYFLFDDVGSSHTRNIVVQTSMNLTAFAYKGQWNQATVTWSSRVSARFGVTFSQAASKGRLGRGYRRYVDGPVTSIFFPKGGAADPVITALNKVRCAGATSGGISGRTRIRVIQYAIYGNRGNAVAKKLRSLWNAGCNIRIIYSVSSRPVLSMLRSRYGRGPVPMKQSVIKNRKGEIVKYNHSKWMAVSGNWGGSRGAWMIHAGSANWSDIAFSSDEQMQEILGYSWTRPYISAFDKTWAQKTSRPPAFGRVMVNGRSLPATPEQPTWGSGVYRNLSPYGD